MSVRLKNTLVAFVLGLAAVLRLGWPGLTEFKADEARLFRLALDLAEFKAFPWCGISSSVGLPNSPISVYLTALPLVLPFLRNPIGGVLWVGLLNTLAVGLCWRIGRRYWGATAGLIAALLFAAAPWAVLYSRKIWAQNYLPLFTLGVIGSLLLAVVDGRRRWIAVHLALLAVLIQIHPSTLALVPLTAIALVLYRRQVDWRWVGIGLGLAVAAFLPYVGCALSRTGTGSGGALAQLAGQPGVLSLDSLALAWLVSVGANIHSLAGPQAFRLYLASVPNLSALNWLEGGLALAGIGYWIAQAVKRRDDPASRAGLIGALWILLPPLFFLRHSTPVYPHYFISLFPAPYLAAGAVLAAAVQLRREAWVKAVAFGAPVVIAVGQVGLTVALLNFLNTHNTPDGFGTPVRMQLSVVNDLRQRLAEAGAAEVLLVSEGDNPAVHSTPAVFDVLLQDVPHRFVNGTTTAVLPAGGAVVILVPGDLAARAQYLAWAEGAVETFPLRPDEGEYQRLTLPADLDAPPPHPANPSALLANGTEIIGYGWSGQATPGGTVNWELWWQVLADGGNGAGQAVHIYNHVLDADENRWGQLDGGAPAPVNWRAGDRVVSYFALAIAPEAAPGPYWVRSGMYTYPEITNVPVLDAAGNPAGDGLKLGPLAGP